MEFLEKFKTDKKKTIEAHIEYICNNSKKTIYEYEADIYNIPLWEIIKEYTNHNRKIFRWIIWRYKEQKLRKILNEAFSIEYLQ